MTTQNLHFNKTDHPEAALRQDRSFFIDGIVIYPAVLPLVLEKRSVSVQTIATIV